MKLLIFAVNQGGPAFHEMEFTDREAAIKAAEVIKGEIGSNTFNWTVMTVIIEDK